MIDQPRIVQSEKQLTAHIPLVVSCADMPKVMGPGITEVFTVLAAQGLKPIGPWFTHHRRRPTDSFDFSICVPVTSAVKPSGRVVGGSLPATTVARTVFHGGYEGLGAAWGEFHAWIAQNGHTPRPDLWECYVQGPESAADPSQWRTELNQPLTATKS
jgi:effector-binding domain-containing protein